MPPPDRETRVADVTTAAATRHARKSVRPRLLYSPVRYRTVTHADDAGGAEPPPAAGQVARLPKGRRVKRVSLGSIVRRDWMVLVAVIVVAGAGFGIYRLHGIFGSNSNTSANSGLSNEIVPFNPKHVVLEVFGAPGATATINYLDVNAQPQQVKDAPLPWSFTITSTEPAIVGNVVAQGNGDTR